MSKTPIELQSSDGDSFKVEEPIAHQSQTIEDDSTENVIIKKKKLPSLKNKLPMSKKTTVLQSSNGESVKVEEATTQQSKTIPLTEDICTKNVIHLDNVTMENLPSTTSKKQTMSKKMIVLQSIDGESFKVDEAMARQSKTISLMIEEDCTKNVITLENVTSKILAIVFEYCKKHHVHADSSSSSSQEDLKKWDTQLMELDQTTIFQLILSSNYLNIKGLHDLTCQTVADMIKGKTVDQIRRHFQIKNDFVPSEEKEIYQENRWLFD